MPNLLVYTEAGIESCSLRQLFIQQDIAKIVTFLYKMRVSFHYSLLNKKITCTGILLGLWSKDPSCNVTEQLFCLHSREWLLLIICLFNKCDQKIRHVKNQIVTHQIPEQKIKATGLVKLLSCFLNGCSVLYLVSSKSRTHYSIVLKFSTVQLE